MALILLFIGFASILGQVVLLRELAVAFFGSELIYLLAIALWLIWTGLGALIGRSGRTRGCAPATLVTGIVLLGIALPLEVVFARAVRLIFAATPGAFMPFGQQIVAMALTLAPAGILLGFLFVQAAKQHVAQGGTFAAAYGYESLGGVIGGLASTFLLAGHLPAFPTILLCSAITFFAALFLAWKFFSLRILFIAVAFGCLGLLVFGGNRLDRATLTWQFPGLLDSRDSPYGRLTMTRHDSQIALFENGALSFETQGTAAEEITHLALLQHPSPQRILLLGGGETGILHEISKHDPERVDYVELDPQIIQLAKKNLPSEIVGPLTDLKVHLIISDGRKFLRETSQRYDVIIIAMPEPASGQANRFYTREFFDDCAKKLCEGGLIAFRLPSAEQYWTAGLARRNASIYRALKSAFADVVVLPGTTNIFLASNAPLTRDPDLLAQRLETRKIKTRLVIPAYIRYLYTNDRFAEIEKSLQSTNAPVNSDLRPICYQLTLVVWLSRFFRPMADFQAGVGAWIGWLLLPVGFIFWVVRRSRFLANVALVFIAGFAGMVMEFAVLLRFQTASGVLFRDIGLLLAGFMAGLAVSPFLGRWIAGTSQGGRFLTASFALLCAASALLFSWEGMRYTIVAVIWLLGVGCGVGAVFCFVTQRNESRGAAFYASDLFGGSLGALLGSLVFLPSLGLSASALWVAGLIFLSLLLI
jgi:spermidine synthase